MAVGVCHIVIVAGGLVIAGAIIAVDAAPFLALKNSFSPREADRCSVRWQTEKGFLNGKVEAIAH